MKMRLLSVFVILTFVAASLVMPSKSHAFGPSCGSMKNNKDHCGLWLCIPAGMGVGCGAMATALAKRLSRGCSPLPSYGSCSNGGNGSYKTGEDPAMSCESGFTRSLINRDVTTNTTKIVGAECVNNKIGASACRKMGHTYAGRSSDDTKVCRYSIPLRQYKYWVQIEVEGQPYKKYWHNAKGVGPNQGTMEYEVNALANSLNLSASQAYAAYARGDRAPDPTTQTFDMSTIPAIDTSLGTSTSTSTPSQTSSQKSNSSNSTAQPVYQYNNGNSASQSSQSSSGLIPGTTLKTQDLPTRQIVDDY